MPKSTQPQVDLTALDRALERTVASGWEVDPAMSTPEWMVLKPPAQGGRDPRNAGFPPLPAKEGDGLVVSLEPQPHGGALKRVEREPEDTAAPAKQILDIGLLSDFVTGARTAEDTAQQAGVTISELHSALATTLAQADPKELAKAMGLQIAATQLKSGAVFNALLADVIEDIREGRAKTDVKLELMKLLARIGRLEPKEEKSAGGTGFQVVIDMGGMRAAPPVTVVESN